MIGVLLRLWWLRQRGVLRQFVRSLRQPVRLIGLLVGGLGLGFIVWTSLGGAHDGRIAAPMSRGSFAVLCAMLFAMAVATGFAQEGPRFTPADVDFLFPAPFTPRQLLLWRLLQLWPLTLVSVGFMTLAFGLRLEHPGRFVVGMALLQLTALHLQLLIAVLLTRLSERASRRLRGIGRTAALLLLFGGLAWVVMAVAEVGGLRAVLAPIADAPTARVLLFPVAACVDFIHADTAAGLGLALARLVAGAGASLALLLSLEVDYLEESVATTARFARVLAARRRGGMAVDESGGAEKGRSLVLAASPFLFRGAGALVWKNLLVVLRSWKAVVPGLMIGLMIVLPGIYAARAPDAPLTLALAALVPATIFWSNALAFDLRRDFDRLDELRALPFRPSALVLAELVVPWVAGVVLQELLLLLVAFSRPVDRELLIGAAAAMPLLMFTALVIDNLALFLFATKGAGASRPSAGTAGQALRPLAWLAAIAPGAVAWFALKSAGVDPRLATAAGVTIDAAIALLLFFLLVRVYESRAATAS